jgi:glutathione S-transferase
MPPLAEILRQRFFFPESERSPVALANARKRWRSVLEVLAAEVAKRGFVAGPALTAADVMMAYGPFLARMVGELPEQPEAVHAYLERVSARPAFERAFGGG